MAHTEATYQAQLTLIQTAITNALANPQPNYKVGQVSYNHADYIKMLFDQQNKLVELITTVVPQESIDTIQTELNEFGQDLIDYINEPNV